MRRATILLFTIIVVIVGAVVFCADQKTSGYDHSLHQAKQKPSPIVDGAVNPGAIPDYAAYEIVFRLLSLESSDDPQGARKLAYTVLSGFNDAEGAAFSNAAYEYKTRI